MKSPSISSHFEELETLIETLESTELPLEDALDTYAKAIKVTKKSVTSLEKSKLKIDTLNAELNELINDDNF